jgi:hypothetical protein
MFSESTALDWVFKAFVAVLAWLGISVHNRVSDLEKDRATKTELQAVKGEYTESLKEMKETMREHREETRAALSEIRSILLEDRRGS